MGFILKEPNTFINIKLTDTGRKMMALGSFNMSKVLLLDREIDYTIDNDNSYNIFDNRVIDPPDFYPDSTPFNLDGSAAFALGAPQITTVKQIVTATTSQVGLVLGGAKAWTLYLSQALGKNRFYYSANTSYSQTIVLDDPGSFFPEVGNLVFIPWVDNISNTSYYASQVIPPAQPVLCLWYRIISAQTPNIVLDRPIPALGSASRTSCYYYPFNG